MSITPIGMADSSSGRAIREPVTTIESSVSTSLSAAACGVALDSDCGRVSAASDANAAGTRAAFSREAAMPMASRDTDRCIRVLLLQIFGKPMLPADQERPGVAGGVHRGHRLSFCVRRAKGGPAARVRIKKLL